MTETLMQRTRAFLRLLVFVSTFLVALAKALSPDLGDASCSSLLLVSSWAKNNVKIYDGCSGNYIRDLDSQNLIKGPLGLLESPSGDLLVISETNALLLKFDRNTLSRGSVLMGNDPSTAEIETNFIASPSGAVLDDDGFLYAVSFGTNRVVKINTQTWKIVDTMLPANNGLIRGIDDGITIGHDGDLYLPGFESNNIIKLNLTTKVATSVVEPGAGGLKAPRTIILRGDELFVSGERSNVVSIFDASSGQWKQNLIEISGPTGMMDEGDGHFIVNNSKSVFSVNYTTGEAERIVENGAGELLGGTFVYRMQKIESESDGDRFEDKNETTIHGTAPQKPDSDEDTQPDRDEGDILTNPLPTGT